MTIEEELKKQKIEFLMLMDTDPYEWAIDRAYLTFCRVLDGYTKWEKEKCKMDTPKKKARDLLRGKIEDYFQKPPQDFDKWHRDLATSLREEYKDFSAPSCGCAFTYGCAQKWINMTFKYLYAITDFSDLLKVPGIRKEAFQYCHIPLDSYVLKNATTVLQLPPQWGETPWSRLDNYDEYKAYEDRLRQYAEAHDVFPLDLDFALWAKEPEKARAELESLGIIP